MQTAQELSNEEKDRRYEAAVQLKLSGHYEDALELFRQWHDEAEDSDERLIYAAGMIDCLDWLGRSFEAIQLVEQASAIIPKSSQAGLAFGLSAAASYASKGDFQKSADIYERLLQVYAEHLEQKDLRILEFDTRLRTADVLIQLRRTGDAKRHLDKVLRGSPDREQLELVNLYLGTSDYVEGNTASAVRYMEQAVQGLKELKHQVKARFYLGAAYLRLQSYRKAFEQYKFCHENMHTGAIDPKFIEEMYVHAKNQKSLHRSD